MGVEDMYANVKFQMTMSPGKVAGKRHLTFEEDILYKRSTLEILLSASLVDFRL